MQPNKKVDHCTMFPEKWVAWSKYGWKVVDISDCCKLHDVACSTSKFAKCLRNKMAVGAWLITLGGAIGCWVKYPLTMLRRL